MDAELVSKLGDCMAGRAERDELAMLVSSYDIWNGWQDEEPEIVALHAIVGPLNAGLTEISEGLEDESALRELVESILTKLAKPVSQP